MNFKIEGLGKIIEERRKTLQLTQRQLAERVGIRSSAQISGLERDQFDLVSDEKLEKILIELNLTATASAMSLSTGKLMMCVNPECGGIKFMNIGFKIIALPGFFIFNGSLTCPICGKQLALNCPACGKDLKYGSLCLSCTTPYGDDLAGVFWDRSRLGDPKATPSTNTTVDNVRHQIATLDAERTEYLKALNITTCLSAAIELPIRLISLEGAS